MNKNDNILFSIIIPTFNRAGIIGRAIESVLAQTYPYWELIVIDDGSTDNTREIVQKYKDKRIKYFYQENKELNGARNKGVELSLGEYIGFLDDDDEYMENHLENFKNAIINSGNKIGIYKSGLLLKIRDKLIKTENYNNKKHKNPVNYILFGETNLLPLIFHKKIFLNLKFNTDCILFDDHNFLIKAVLEYPFIETNTYTCIYIKHPEARTIMYFKEKNKLDNLLNCVEELFNTKGEEIELSTHKHIKSELNSTFYLNFAHKSINYKNYFQSLKYIAKALKTYRNSKIIKRSIIVIIRLVYRIIIKIK